MSGRLKNTTIKRVEDGENTVTTTESSTFSVKTSVDDFYFTFVEFMSGLFKIKSTTDMRVLAKMCMLMQYNTNVVTLASATRIKMCEELSIENSHLSISLKRLLQLNIIEGGKGEFRVSPEIFWKGNMKERSKLLCNKDIAVNFLFTSKEFD